MALNYKDIELENQSFGNLADTLLRNRQLKAEEQRYGQEQQRLTQNEQQMAQYRGEEMRQRMASETERERHDRAMEGKGTASKFTWTGDDGVKYEATPDDFAARIQAHPAKKEDDGSATLDMSGQTADGVTIKQTIKLPHGQAGQATQTAAGIVKDFIAKTGIVPKPVGSTSTSTVTGRINPATGQPVTEPEVTTRTTMPGTGAATALPAAKPPAPLGVGRNKIPDQLAPGKGGGAAKAWRYYGTATTLEDAKQDSSNWKAVQ